MNLSDSTAIADPKDAKIAALFFDYVLPVSPGWRPYQFLAKDAPPIPRGIIFPEWKKSIAWLDLELSSNFRKAKNRYSSTKDKNLMYFLVNESILSARKRLSRDKIRSTPIFTDDEYYNFFNIQNSEKSLEITLAGIPIVDAEKMTWEHITDVRQDPDFKKHTRNFRLFILDNYQGKSKNYILDSLAKKVDDYELACKKHGIDLTFSTIKTTLDSQSILATLGITATAILLNQPIVAGGTLLAGASIEIGKIALHILEKRTAMKFIKNESDISYLYGLKEKAENKKGKKGSV